MAKRGLSSVQRTLRACREQGRFVEKLEQWITYKSKDPNTPKGTRRDAFGFIDIMAIDTDCIVAIQACTQTGKQHKESILDNEYAHAWLKTGARIELWVWRKIKVVRGMKRERWEPKIENITLKEFENKLPEKPF
jgi:hypothetical protein